MATVESISGFGVEVIQPSSPPLIVSFVGTDDGTAQVAVQQVEVDLVKDLDRESFIRNYPPLEYWELDKAATKVDPLYKETSAPAYKQPVGIPIFIMLKPPKRMLKRFGLEAEHEALGLVSQGWLDRHAVSLQMKTGDRIAYYATPYVDNVSRPGGLPDSVVTHEASPRSPNFAFEVLTAKWCDYFANTQIPIHKILSLKNLRAPGKPDTNVPKKSN